MAQWSSHGNVASLFARRPAGTASTCVAHDLARVRAALRSVPTRGEDAGARRAELREREGLERDLAGGIGLGAGDDVPQVVRLADALDHVRGARVADVGRRAVEHVGREAVRLA